MTDNDNLPSKLALRRRFLRKYNPDGDARVFDACQGGGVIWKKLREEFTLQTYWGTDLKRKSGRLNADSVLLLEAGLTENVIDVDTYGSPWAHWVAILKNLREPTTVFLTIGEHGVRQRPLSLAEAKLLGLSSLYARMPNKLKLRLARTMLFRIIACAEHQGAHLIEVAEASRGLSARYLGVRLAPGHPPDPDEP